MKSLKDEVLKAIASLPDDVPIDEIMYRIYVIDKIRKGQKDVREGRVLSTDELKKEIEKW